MELIETSLFTKQVQATLSDEEYRALQLHLILQPDVGDLIRGPADFGKCADGCRDGESEEARG